jgi:chromosome segregation protein
VLEREGESAYFINNMHVRRKDVADIFLGTGLGGRAYAIIEQGMISRIVDARPEELRTFLEEAAGISKYRERRRETELRLEDTRENLARVDDILQELTKQLEHLEGQAEVASRNIARWKPSSSSLNNCLWLLRRQDAANQRNRLNRDIEQVGLQLEAETARLRELELALEQSRQAHYAPIGYGACARRAPCTKSTPRRRASSRRSPPARQPAPRVKTAARGAGRAQCRAIARMFSCERALSAQQDALGQARNPPGAAPIEHESLTAALPEAEAESARTRAEVESAQQETARCEQRAQGETTRHVARAARAVALEQR